MKSDKNPFSGGEESMPAFLFRFKYARILSVVLALGLGGAMTAPAYAFGLPFHSLKWYSQHMYYRIGAGHFEYLGSSEPVILRDPSAEARLSVDPGPIKPSGAKISNDNTLTMISGFFIPKTDHHLSLEFQLAPPLDFKFYATGAAAHKAIAAKALGGRLNTGVPAIGEKIGRFQSLPPNFTLVYRPFTHTAIRPYIGAGMIWLYTYNVHVTNPVLTTAPGSDPKLHFTKPIGCVVHGGFDIALPLEFYLTADAKYVGCADVDAKLTGARVQSALAPFGNGVGSVALGPIRNTVHFRAVLYQITIGRTFWG
jgi:outer membrane protein W